jgi:hypothetical protein
VENGCNSISLGLSLEDDSDEPLPLHLFALESLESSRGSPGHFRSGTEEPYDSFPCSFEDRRDDHGNVEASAVE